MFPRYCSVKLTLDIVKLKFYWFTWLCVFSCCMSSVQWIFLHAYTHKICCKERTNRKRVDNLLIWVRKKNEIENISTEIIQNENVPILWKRNGLSNGKWWLSDRTEWLNLTEWVVLTNSCLYMFEACTHAHLPFFLLKRQEKYKKSIYVSKL